MAAVCSPHHRRLRGLREELHAPAVMPQLLAAPKAHTCKICDAGTAGTTTAEVER